MNWIDARESSHIKRFGYDSGLVVEFQNGSTYHWELASPADVQRMAAAHSAGEYLHQHIKRKYGPGKKMK